MPWTLFCLLLLRAGTAVSSSELQCFMWPAGALHPVQAQLERIEAVTGCAAREGGAKETHVISVGKTSNKQVTVVLRTLNLFRPVNRPVILVLSSQHAMRWVVENEGLPHNINLLVQVSQNSTVTSASASVRVVQVPFLPRRPQVLLGWVLQRHSSISSLIHAVHSNRVSLRLGEDPSMPSECRLRSLFMSQNYQASELHEQEVHGCVSSGEPADTEVHIIRLWSSGSALCGSLQADVSVFLSPSESHSGHHNIVLILSSAVSVTWALVAPDVKGHIRVYSSTSVNLLYSQSPELTVTSTVTSDLLSPSDLIEWANQKNISNVTSYTEADLANRFVVKLRGGGQGGDADADVSQSESRRLNIFQEDLTAHKIRDAISCQCDEVTLNVTVDRHILQAMSLSVMSVSLRDHGCQAKVNRTHFLMNFPVISCGTEDEMDEVNRKVRYTNTVFLWKTSEGSNNQTDEMNPLGVQISCEVFLSSPVNKVDVSPSSGPVEELQSSHWIQRSHTSPMLSMELFVTESYERRAVGPCVITAYDRLYVQISVVAGVEDAVELNSCRVSSLSDPQAHSDWHIIRRSCPSDPTFTLTNRQTEEERHNSTEKDRTTQKHVRNERQLLSRWRETESELRRFKRAETDRFRAMMKPEVHRREMRDVMMNEEETAHTLRFSFIFRPVFNNSIQFLHCSLRLCVSGLQTDEKPSVNRVCKQGQHIPAFTNTPASQQCEYRNLSRPVLVTSPVEFMAPPAGKLSQKPTQMPRQAPSPKEADTGAVLVIVFTAFVMGFSLMGALWCIYTRTGINTRRQHPREYDRQQPDISAGSDQHLP
nr:transforming growth factor beta receptor type 3 isoform X1 [Misgurnus anguillicaudatus]